MIFIINPKMNDLPDEIWTEIILYLPVRDLLKFNITCSYFHKIVKEYKITDGKYVHDIRLSCREQLINYNFRSYRVSYTISSKIYQSIINDTEINNLLKNVIRLELGKGCLSNKLLLPNLRSLVVFNNEKYFQKYDFISNLIGLTHLQISGEKMKDGTISTLTNLISLRLVSCENITSRVLIHLSNLQKLDLCRYKCSKAIDINIESLSNLFELTISNYYIANVPFNNLINLSILNLDRCDNQSLSGLMNLSTLSLHNCKNICIKHLTNLTQLKISYSDCMDIKSLIHLNKLYIDHCDKIIDINCLTNLTNLSLTSNGAINDISNLTNLLTLLIEYSSNITDNSISNLINLQHLHITCNNKISNKSIMNLSNLLILDVRYCDSITSDINLPKLERFKHKPDPDMCGFDALEYDFD